VLALNISANPTLATEQLELVRSPDFRAARTDLEIDRFVFLVIPGYPVVVPKASELLDMLYRVVEGGEECAVVVLD
jgi:hypothetical protein